jgi:seryl-tRNA synthetase
MATVEELQAELDEIKKGNDALANKNKELLNELKTERKKHRENDIGSDKFYALQDKHEETIEQFKKLQHDFKSKTKELEKVAGARDELNKNLQNVLVDGGLSANLAKVGVKAEFLDATKALLRSQVQIVDDKAVVGDKELGEYIGEWAKDAGKPFVSAPKNNGGGAGGGGGTPNNGVVGKLDGTKEEQEAYIRAKYSKE